MKSGRKLAQQKFGRFGMLLRFVFIACGFMSGTLIATQEVVLAWNPVPSPLVGGYRVHYGTQSRSYDTHVDVGTNAIARLSGLADGTLYFFAVTAYDVFQNESDYSGEICYVTPGTNAVSPYVNIVEQPRQQAAALGSNVTLSVAATGGGTLSYQWRKEEKNLPSATSSHLTVSAAEAQDAGRYSVVVKNELGSTVSYSVALRVIIPPRFESANRLADGSIRLIIGNSDGSAVSSLQAFRFGVEASIDPRPTAAWTPLTNSFLFEDGCCLLKDPQSLNQPQRYYRSVDYGGSIGPLRMSLSRGSTNGMVQLRARLDTAARALTPSEVALVQFETTENPGLPDSWMPLTQPPGLVSGEAVVEDGDSHLWPKRFYRAVVREGGAPAIRLQTVPPDADQMFRLRLGRADGQALTALEVFNYEVWVKTHLLSDSDWQLLTNPFTLTNGKLITLDTAASASPVRIYRVYAR